MPPPAAYSCCGAPLLPVRNGPPQCRLRRPGRPSDLGRLPCEWHTAHAAMPSTVVPADCSWAVSQGCRLGGRWRLRGAGLQGEIGRRLPGGAPPKPLTRPAWQHMEQAETARMGYSGAGKHFECNRDGRNPRGDLHRQAPPADSRHGQDAAGPDSEVRQRRRARRRHSGQP